MTPLVVSVSPERYDAKALAPAAAVLNSGGLVAFPTETVYGLAVRADREESVRRLLETRGSPRDKVLTLHIADVDDVQRYVGTVPHLAYRYIREFWPGPLTLVLPKGAGTVSLRHPANRIAQDLIRQAHAPIVAPSANKAGQAPACTAAQVMAVFRDAIDCVVDGGPTPLGQTSTVVRILGRKPEILREGAIPRDRIEGLTYVSVLFVCTGNTCRSPLAEGIFRRALAQRLGVPAGEIESRGFRVASAGTGAATGMPAARNTIEVLRERGVDLAGHESRPVTASMIHDADFVLALSTEHVRSMKEWVPESTARIALLDPAGRAIEDPIGGSLDLYRATADRIESCLAAWIALVMEARTP